MQPMGCDWGQSCSLLQAPVWGLTGDEASADRAAVPPLACCLYSAQGALVLREQAILGSCQREAWSFLSWARAGHSDWRWTSARQSERRSRDFGRSVACSMQCL